MPIKNVLASVAVSNLEAAVAWYERLFKQPASRPMPEVAEWSFERGGSLQVYELAERAGSGSFTVIVSNIDEEIRHLSEMGITKGDPSFSDRVKTLMFTDPDGNHIAFAEPIDPSLAH